MRFYQFSRDKKSGKVMVDHRPGVLHPFGNRIQYLPDDIGNQGAIQQLAGAKFQGAIAFKQKKAGALNHQIIEIESGWFAFEAGVRITKNNGNFKKQGRG